mmetsp:Transcript_5593/g.18000  ORF Transcript_5593/g.18000 Transcript_5593/m.18000 type:complete len:351 (+) Transcript_5593:188-1240(+)
MKGRSLRLLPLPDGRAAAVERRVRRRGGGRAPQRMQAGGVGADEVAARVGGEGDGVQVGVAARRRQGRLGDVERDHPGEGGGEEKAARRRAAAHLHRRREGSGERAKGELADGVGEPEPVARQERKHGEGGEQREPGVRTRVLRGEKSGGQQRQQQVLLVHLKGEEEEGEAARRRAEQESAARGRAQQQRAGREECGERASEREPQQRLERELGLELKGRQQRHRAPHVGNLVLVQRARGRKDAAQHGERRVVRRRARQEGRPARGEGERRDGAKRAEAARGEADAARAQHAGEQVAKDGRREVEAHLLEVERERKGDAAGEGPPRQRRHQRPQRQPQRHAVVLKVAVVD